MHAVYLYSEHDISSSRYVPMMLAMSAKDSLIILGLFFFISFFCRSLAWLKFFTKANLTAFIICSMMTATAIEWVSVYVMARWSYREAMPTIFGIGLSPLIQLTCTGLLSLWLSKKILYGVPLLSQQKPDISTSTNPPNKLQHSSERHKNAREQ